VAGVDCGFDESSGLCHAAAVIWSIAEAAVVEARIVSLPGLFPYVPGLLSFRELPAILAALDVLDGSFDAVMCDGHGIAHPRRLGIASHLGLIIDKPTVGCAKSRLVGEHTDPGSERGARVPLLHRGERIGSVLRTRDGVRPVFVSIGHRIDLDAAVALVLACHEGYRLPGPTRHADALVSAHAREYRLHHVRGADQPGGPARLSSSPRTRSAQSSRRIGSSS